MLLRLFAPIIGSVLFLAVPAFGQDDCPDIGTPLTITGLVDHVGVNDGQWWEILPTKDIQVAPTCYLWIVGGEGLLPSECNRAGAYFTATGTIQVAPDLELGLIADRISCR